MNILNKTFLRAFVAVFILSSLNLQSVQGQGIVMPVLPKPGTMVNLSEAFVPAHLNGIVIHPDNPLQFDFIINPGQSNLDKQEKDQEYTKLVKYFLAALTVPDENQWVNLSPYEKDRIVAVDFGRTEMGRDLLVQDYLLKQITSSLMYPESGLGKSFWDKVYAKSQEQPSSNLQNVSINTFNKVWIVPAQAIVYESGNMAYIEKSHLKVMLEEDYLASQKAGPAQNKGTTHKTTQDIIRQIILPELEREVNQGKNFAQLRQVFSAMILATWYKKSLKESLLSKVYADKAKVVGVNQDPANNEKIYKQYLLAFKKGVYNYIKVDTDRPGVSIPRKYFSGGVTRGPNDVDVQLISNQAMAAKSKWDNQEVVRVALDAISEIQKPEIPKVLFLGDDILPVSTTIHEGDFARLESYIRKGTDFYVETYTDELVLRKWDKPQEQAIRIRLGATPNIEKHRRLLRALIDQNDKMKVHFVSTPQGLVMLYKKDAAMAVKDKVFKQRVPANPGIIEQRVQWIDRAYDVKYYEGLDKVRDFLFGRLSLNEAARSNVLEDFRYKMSVLVSAWLSAKHKLNLDQQSSLQIFLEEKIPFNGYEKTLKIFSLRSQGEAILNEAIEMMSKDQAMINEEDLNEVDSFGGIDMNAKNMSMQIKRDGNGVPLSLAQQNVELLSEIEGFMPRIIAINPASTLPIFQNFQPI
jgi:hypothetical protein